MSARMPGARPERLRSRPGLEGWDPVVAEQAERGQNLYGALDAEPGGGARGTSRIADLIAVGMAGQQDDQRAIDPPVTQQVQPRASPMAWAAARPLASHGLARSAWRRRSNRV